MKQITSLVPDDFDYNSTQGKALALAMAGVTVAPEFKTNPVIVARSTGIPLQTVMRAFADQQWIAHIEAITKKHQGVLVSRGLGIKTNRVHSAIGIHAALQEIARQRSIAYTTPDECSDDEMRELGVSIDKRNTAAAKIPGANTGYLAVTTAFVAVVTQDGAVKGRIPVLEGTVDTALINAQMNILQYIAKELGEFQPDTAISVEQNLKLYAKEVDIEKV